MKFLAPGRWPSCSHFYKYGSEVSWLRDILLNHRVYLPTIPQLNDPAEGKPRIAPTSARDIARALTRHFQEMTPNASLDETAAHFAWAFTLASAINTEKVLREAAQVVHLHVERFHVYCMSRRWDNMAMWANYANRHAGYCLKFANAGIFEWVREVEYGDLAAIDVVDPGSIGALSFLRKKSDWRSEEEVRLVVSATTERMLAFEPALLTTVILGKEMTAEHQSNILGWAALRQPPLTVVKAAYDSFEHVLKLAPLSLT